MKTNTVKLQTAAKALQLLQSIHGGLPCGKHLPFPAHEPETSNLQHSTSNAQGSGVVHRRNEVEHGPQKIRLLTSAATFRIVLLLGIAAVLSCGTAAGQDSEIQQLRRAIEQMQRTIDAQNARISELEKRQTNAEPRQVYFRPDAGTNIISGVAVVGHASPVTARAALDDKQEAAARPKDYTLDPDYRGYFPVPSTPFLVKFNPKPHLDLTIDDRNTGDRHRFVTARIPLKGDPDYGGGEQFNLNANASQLRVDIRAPSVPGDFRFYYQNDFFGQANADMRYRLQHLYGQFYGFIGGFTYGIFEDPDGWPDTVDYEGPNAVIFARRPVAQYKLLLAEAWHITFGVEKPDIFLDTSSFPDATLSTPMPDLGFNVRWEAKDFGHVQASAITRVIGAHGPGIEDQDVFGWGLNVSAGLKLTERDTLQLWGVYGEGIGGMGNDTSFVNSDAAFTAGGNLEALEYYSGMVGFTHRWNDCWRSTATYGYAHLENTSGQPGDAYKLTHYASANVIWQIRKRLSVGLEGLYGFREVRSGRDGDAFRLQLGMVYSLFD